MKVLCYAPYSAWTLHTSRQVTILHGLELRGCEVTYVTCDGVFSECDMYQPSKGEQLQRKGNTCSLCQASTAEFLYRLGRPFKWLGRWLTSNDFHAALEWSHSIETSELTNAQWDRWPIGEWVKSSVHGHFRANSLDLKNQTVEQVYRRYLYSGYLACVGLNRLLDDENPDTLLLFNGRMAPYRIMMDLAMQRGIRVICEERGFSPGLLRLTENHSCVAPEPVLELWNLWRGIPLTDLETQDVQTLLDAHLGGGGLEYSNFAIPGTGPTQIHAQLGFDRNRPLYALYTSSSDEVADIAEAQSPYFTNQDAWIDQTIEIFKHRPDWQLAIRTHPNTGGKRAVGNNEQELQFFENLRSQAPPNVYVIAPDEDVSSFDLMIAADVGMVWHSSMAIDMSAIGRPVMLAGAYRFRDADFLIRPNVSESYESALQFCIDDISSETLLNNSIFAWRFAHALYFKHGFTFPLVAQPNTMHGEPAFKSLNELKPGRDSSLDRICSIIMNGDSVHPFPDSRPPETSASERAAISSYIARFAKQ